MFSQPPFHADVSARLDQLLSGYLHAHPVVLHPRACPPWRPSEAARHNQLAPVGSENIQAAFPETTHPY